MLTGHYSTTGTGQSLQWNLSLSLSLHIYLLSSWLTPIKSRRVRVQLAKDVIMNNKADCLSDAIYCQLLHYYYKQCFLLHNVVQLCHPILSMKPMQWDVSNVGEWLRLTEKARSRDPLASKNTGGNESQSTWLETDIISSSRSGHVRTKSAPRCHFSLLTTL